MFSCIRRNMPTKKFDCQKCICNIHSRCYMVQTGTVCIFSVREAQQYNYLVMVPHAQNPDKWVERKLSKVFFNIRYEYGNLLKLRNSIGFRCSLPNGTLTKYNIEFLLYISNIIYILPSLKKLL